MRLLYDLWYRFGTPPWVGGPREHLVRLVEDGRLRPGRAVDLGCGTGANAIHLARQGFQVTGLDFAASAIQRARADAAAAGVDVDFRIADLTDLPDLGPFDVLVDYGTYDDLRPAAQARYRDEVARIAAPDARFLLWCFEWHPSRGDRVLEALFRTGITLRPGQVAAEFGDHWTVERIDGEETGEGWPKGWACYLMDRR